MVTLRVSPPGIEWKTGRSRTWEKNGRKKRKWPTALNRKKMTQKGRKKWKKRPQILFLGPFWDNFFPISGRGPFSIFRPIFSRFRLPAVFHSIPARKSSLSWVGASLKGKKRKNTYTPKIWGVCRGPRRTVLVYRFGRPTKSPKKQRQSRSKAGFLGCPEKPSYCWPTFNLLLIFGGFCETDQFLRANFPGTSLYSWRVTPLALTPW